MHNRVFFIALTVSMVLFSCKKKEPSHQQQVNTTPPPITGTTNVIGYNLLSKICGIWNGGVTSTTPLGNYPQWIVDFRPISAAQVGAKNELDTANNIFMTFFICYHDSAYKLAFRNGGAFTGLQRVSYMVIDSVSETSNQSFYRFGDFVKGTSVTQVDVTFKQDSLIIQAWVFGYPHMQWRAQLQDTTSCQPAIAHFNFPQKMMVQNFSNTFANDTNAIFFQDVNDPYPGSAQPYVGQSTLSYTSNYSLTGGHNVFLLVTTQPLISNYTYNAANMKYVSRYVLLDTYQSSFTFNLMHPGTYYLYAYYDANGDGVLDSGDYVSAANTTFTLAPTGTVSATTNMDYQIP